MKTDTRQFRPETRSGHHRASPLDVVEGLMDETLDEALDTITDPTTAALRIIEWDEDDQFFETGKTVTVTNRSIDLTVEENTYVICLKINGEWRVIWADCSAAEVSASSESSGGTAAPGTGGGTVFGGPVYGGP